MAPMRPHAGLPSILNPNACNVLGTFRQPCTTACPHTGRTITLDDRLSNSPAMPKPNKDGESDTHGHSVECAVDGSIPCGCSRTRPNHNVLNCIVRAWRFEMRTQAMVQPLRKMEPPGSGLNTPAPRDRSAPFQFVLSWLFNVHIMASFITCGRLLYARRSLGMPRQLFDTPPFCSSVLGRTAHSKAGLDAARVDRQDDGLAASEQNKEPTSRLHDQQL
mmetsp:Transcript_31733/g.94707  ORF Transcript_31733/g.94707 Transcript_31733/m.94707 type:complete len:219 (+) Transcript_31733:663-1319(+)|eukprot:365647-Chlamydomonas_euryale.AAC.11